jgi:hypothetical protein
MQTLPTTASALVLNTYGLFNPPNLLPGAWYCAYVPKTDCYYYFNIITGKSTWYLNDVVADSKIKRHNGYPLTIGSSLILPWPNIIQIKSEITISDTHININNTKPKRTIYITSPKRIILRCSLCIACLFAFNNLSCLFGKVF